MVSVEDALLTFPGSNSGTHLTLRPLSIEPELFCVELYVSLAAEPFHGAVKTWVWPEVWNAFLQAVEECERTRQGQVILEGEMSSDELKITLEPADGWGHFLVRYEMCGRAYDEPVTLAGSFHLNVEFFGTIAAQARLMQEWTHLALNPNTNNNPAVTP